MPVRNGQTAYNVLIRVIKLFKVTAVTGIQLHVNPMLSSKNL